MKTTIDTQRTITFITKDSHLLSWVESFLIDRKAGGAAQGTIRFYAEKLNLFSDFCDTQAVTLITQIDPNLIRQFLLWLEQTNHNKGGVHGFYRALRCFLNWWENEYEPEGWKNPIKKVKPPKMGEELLAPIPLDSIKAMLDTCDKNAFTGIRDKAILLSLLDTGARASEFLSMNMDDVDPFTGAITIRHGKGDKGRYVFLGRLSRKTLRMYLKKRSDNQTALWVTIHGERLRYDGLREILTRRAKLAGVTEALPHAFRRAFAVNCLKNGMDVYSLQKLMGHSDLQMLRRYLKLSTQDINDAHQRGSPVDNSL